MTDHFQPKPSIIVQRFNFHSLIRKHGESVAIFVAELKKLSEHCGFGDSLNDVLRDRLVCGINNGRIQCRLLGHYIQKKHLRLPKAMEAAERNALDLESSKSEKLHHVKSTGTTPVTSRKPQFSACYRCGGKHRSLECRFKDVTCHNCGKQGHIAKVCKSKVRCKKQAPPSSF